MRQNERERSGPVGPGVIAILLLLLAAGASAVTVSVPADEITRGDQVQMIVSDLPDNSVFTLRISGNFTVTPGGDFAFEANNFALPFNLLMGSLNARLENTRTNTLAVLKGDTEVKKTGNSVDGVYTTTNQVNLTSGTYDYLKMSGKAAPNATYVSGYIEMTGLKAGPRTGTMYFTMDGFNTGTVSLACWVNSSPVLDKTIAVSLPPPTVTATTSPVSDSGGSGGSGIQSGGSGSSATVTKTPTTAPVRTDTTGTPRTETAATPPLSPTPDRTTLSLTSLPTTIPTTTARAGTVPWLAGAAVAAGIVLAARKPRR